MNDNELCISISQSLAPLFVCSPAPQEGVRVRTPMLYPDGDVVDVFILERDNSYTITDFGDALGWLGLQSVSRHRSPKQRMLIQDVCQTLRIELIQGQLVLRQVMRDELGESVLRVAQAAVRVSDLWFTFRSSSHRDASNDVATSPTSYERRTDGRWALQTTADEVDEWLREKTITFERAVKEMGRSTREWTIDFRTTTTDRTTFVFLLSADSRRTAPSVTNRVVTGCVDLNHLKESHNSLALISLFDDTEDIWRSDDFALLENVSEIARWSRPGEFESLLWAT